MSRQETKGVARRRLWRRPKKEAGKNATDNNKDKSLESWIWDAACSIRGAKDAPKYKDYILPLIFTKRLCDVFDDDRLSNLIEAISTKRLGLDDVEADIIGKSYEYLIRKFAEGGGQSAGEFYTPPEV
ncbi:MAG: type I restriction-modification system subunit M N-terminal domain-containing protein, partial [Sedimenticolaceae bacterium]